MHVYFADDENPNAETLCFGCRFAIIVSGVVVFVAKIAQVKHWRNGSTVFMVIQKGKKLAI